LHPTIGTELAQQQHYKHQTNITGIVSSIFFEKYPWKESRRLGRASTSPNTAATCIRSLFSGAPEDTVRALGLDVPTATLTKKVRHERGYTPLHPALPVFRKYGREILRSQAGKQPRTLYMKDAEGRVPLTLLVRKESYRYGW
jgi:hypothetical protein